MTPTVQKLVTVTYLEMTSPAQLRPARPPELAFQVMRAEIPCPELNRFLYVAVGTKWIWYGRLSWDRKQWMAYLDRPELETWLGYARGTPAGYFELERQGEDVEIVYFGLLPGFIGQGLGGALLNAAIAAGLADGRGPRLGAHLRPRPSSRARQLPGTRDGPVQGRAEDGRAARGQPRLGIR